MIPPATLATAVPPRHADVRGAAKGKYGKTNSWTIS
jgi:hypothetical protein